MTPAMHKRTIFLLALVGLCGCSRAIDPPGDALAQSLAGRVAGTPRSCISINSIDNLRVIDPTTIGYGSGPTIYVNQLRAPCSGARQLNTIIVDAHGSQYCNGDHFQVIEPGSIIPGPACFMGDWVPYHRP